jgi:hypothetical protein
MLIVEPTDVIIEGFKGDDTFINAKEIRLTNFLMHLSAGDEYHIPMKSDVDFPEHVDYCGFYLSPFGLIPDLIRYLNKFGTKDITKYNPKVKDYPEELRKSMQDKVKFFTYEKIVYLYKIYKDLYDLNTHQIDMIFSTFKYFTMWKLQSHHMTGMAALYDSDDFYKFEDRTVTQMNSKRIYSDNHGETEQLVGWW